MAWSERVAAHAAKMRKRSALERIAEDARLRALIPPLLPSGPVRKPIKSPARRRAPVEAHERRKAAVMARRAKYEQIAVEAEPGQRRVLFPYDYPACPHGCGESVIRAGQAHGEQRYRCQACNRTFNGRVAAEVRPVDVVVTCHRCGTQGAPRGRGKRPYSGIVGWCPNCRKRFTQGGRWHLDNTLMLLVQRVKSLALPDDAAAEAYAQAALDVLAGKGYTFNVELDRKAAFGRARGEWGQGSDHPIFKMHQGQNTRDGQ